MAHWILKTEPSTYSFADLRRDKRTRWDGITNAQALKFLREMAVGDECMIYHSGDERALVGYAKVIRAAYIDDGQADPRLVSVDIAAGVPFPHPVPLAAIKADGAFAQLGLVRQGRLSVVPVPAPAYERLVQLANGMGDRRSGAVRTRR
jgi:predicted RNA-binding protein with PUA-like domain